MVNDNFNFDYLINIIENYDDNDLRIRALSQLEKLKMSNQRLFNFLENIAVSDESTNIKAKASEIIVENYLKLGKNVIEWIIKNENSIFVLKSILKKIEQIDFIYYKDLKKLLVDRYTDIYRLTEEELEFFID